MVITNENYYSPEANRRYMSVSQFKSFINCEAAAMAELRGEYEKSKTTARMVGSYVDAYFEGTIDKFKEENPEIFKKDGSLKIDYARAESMIARVQRDPLFMEYMSGEKQRIFTGELFGAKWKVKIDSYHRNRMIVDLKTSRSLERIMGKSMIEHFGYDIQGAVYQAVEGNRLPFYLAIVTKEDPPDIEICQVESVDLNEALNYVKTRLPRVLEVKHGNAEPERCGVCPYCRTTKKLVAPIPSYELGFSAIELKAMRGEI